jgi:hypothetical protein
MAESTPEPVRMPPRRILAAAAMAVVLAAWWLLHTYTSAGTRECEALYKSARSAADTARIDTVVTAGSRAQNEPRTCGFLRKSARWQ